MDESFIWVSVISGLFGLVGLELLTHNWFRKERFKLEAYNMKKQNELQLKKMAKELGLTMGKSSVPEPIQSNNMISQFLPEIIKNLEPEQLSALADRFIPENEEGGGSTDGLIDWALKNPDVLKGIVQGFSGAKKENTESGEGWIK